MMNRAGLRSSESRYTHSSTPSRSLIVAADQKSLVNYIQTYNNPGLRSLNFDQLPLDGGAIKVMTLDQPPQVTVLRP
jgi:hypothetical protein